MTLFLIIHSSRLINPNQWMIVSCRLCKVTQIGEPPPLGLGSKTKLVLPNLMCFARLQPGISSSERQSWAKRQAQELQTSSLVGWLNIASIKLIVQGLQGRHGDERSDAAIYRLKSQTKQPSEFFTHLLT